MQNKKRRRIKSVHDGEGIADDHNQRQYCPHCDSETRRIGRTDLTGNPVIEHKCPTHGYVEPNPTILADGGVTTDVTSVLEQWGDERIKRVRAATIHPSQRGAVDPNDLLHTILINRGELVLQVEHECAINYVWPTPAKEGIAQFVAIADRHEASGLHQLAVDPDDVSNWIRRGDWSIVHTDECGIERPDAAMEGL